MKSYQFSNYNLTLVKPSRMSDEECKPLTAFKGVDEAGFPFLEVGFTPTQKDIESMQAGRPIHIRVLGSQFSPMSVFTTDADGNVNPEEPEHPKFICPESGKEKDEDDVTICKDCPGECYNK